MVNTADVAPPRSHAGFESAVDEVGRGFSLSSLILFVTLACVVFGVITIAPGLGVPLAVIALIAWARTIREVRSEKTVSGEPNVALVFLQSIGVALMLLTLIAVGTFAAFFVVCLTAVGAMSSDNVVTSVVLGVLLLIGVFVALIRTLRRVQNE
jgi:hypothetical protein